MIKRRLPILLGLLALALMGGGIYWAWFRPEAPVNDDYEWVLVKDGFTRPVFLTHAEDERLYVVEQRGKIWILEQGEILPDPFLDIEDRTDDNDNESGLLSLAFDPNFAENNFIYVYYNALPDLTSTIARYVVDETGLADPATEAIILQIEQPYGNHNGGLVQFGPDGYLYIGMGDGGSHSDPHGNGQNLETLLGKMLRIDVNKAPYQIPENNPFVDDEDVLPEIWAYGLRNPWRWSFDRQTGDLYIGDVGQNNIEEVNFQAANSAGGQNYGWRLFEGFSRFDRKPNLNTADFTPPIHDYTHAEIVPVVQSNVFNAAHCSVTGGYVYRGAELTALVGKYIYGDYCSGTIWTLEQIEGEWVNTHFMNTDFTITSFGEDWQGELYITSFSNGGIWKLVKKD